MIVSDNVRKLWIEMRDHEHMGDTPIIDGLKNESTNEVLIDAGIRNSWVANECATCPYPPGNRGPLCGSEYVKLAELESRWNEMPDCVNEKTQIVGFHRHNAFTKRRQIKGFIAKWQPF